MRTKQWHTYLVDLNPKDGTKPGKIRPCLCIRPDHFSSLASTVVVPFTSVLRKNVELYYPLRLRILSGTAGLEKTSDLLIEQIMAVDNSKFISELGSLPEALRRDVRFALREFLDL